MTDANIGGYYLSKNMVNHISVSTPYGGIASISETIGEAKNLKSFLYIGESPQVPNIGIGIAAAVGLAKFGKKKEAPAPAAETPSTVTPPPRNTPTPPERKKD